jgi:hypothetical protein
LVSPVHFGHNTIWIKSPDEKVDADTMTSVGLGREIFKDEFASALLYKLHRKKQSKSNDKSKADNKSTEDTSTNIQLLVIWGHITRSGFFARALLIKHSNVITWDEDTLEKLHSMHLVLLRDDQIVEDTWRLDNATVLRTSNREVGHTFEITISEGTREDGTMEPLWVSLNT